jgi:hypothetical protein
MVAPPSAALLELRNDKIAFWSSSVSLLIGVGDRTLLFGEVYRADKLVSLIGTGQRR